MIPNNDPTPPDHTLGAIRALLDSLPAEDEGLHLHPVSKGRLVDATRHLLDVVGRQREVLVLVEWRAGGGGDFARCPCCRNWEEQGHTPTCALDALLRETR